MLKKKDFLKIINLYRSTSDSDLLRRVQNDLKLGFPGARRFQPTEVFIATWNEVGYYEEKSNKVLIIFWLRCAIRNFISKPVIFVLPTYLLSCLQLRANSTFH